MKKKYLIKRLNCTCNVCTTRFNIDLPADVSIVKIVSDYDNSIYWLPLAGKNGYFDLMEKLTNYNKNNKLDMRKVAEFEKSINNILLAKGIDKNLSIDKGERRCPICKSENVKVINEEFIDNYNFAWLDLDEM